MMHRRCNRLAAAILGLVALMASACGDGGASPASSSAASLAGTIVDWATRLGVSGARVEVIVGTNVGQAATTDETGRFRLEGLGPNEVTLLITHPLYVDDRKTARPGAAAATWILRPRPCDASVCGGASECNRVMRFLQAPFETSDYFNSSQFDHDTQNGTFVNYCGRATTYDGHGGYDWALRVGTPILAAAGGTVTSAGPDPEFFCPFLGRAVSGITMTIRHVSPTGEIFWTLYTHLSALAVTPGQQVAAGDVIAASGNTGCSTAPHLHFQVMREFGSRPGSRGQFLTDPYGWQGAGDDPWATNPNGAYSAWLWTSAPAIRSVGGESVRELHPPGTSSRGIVR